MSFIKKSANAILGKKAFQGFFSKLHLFALYGLNYGRGGLVGVSGEENVLKILDKSSVSKDPQLTIIDAGANVGEYALSVQKYITSNKQIFALEPVKDTFAKLSANTQAHNSIIPLNVGLGKDTVEIEIFKNALESKHASLYQRNMDHWDNNLSLNQSEIVKILSFEEFVSSQNLTHIHLLKMDTEGHEFSILQGATNWLKDQKIDLIQFEFGVCNVDSKVFFKDFYQLLNPNYAIFRILDDGFALVDKYSERHEVFLTTNYLAVSKLFLAKNKSLFN
ncbi:MAG TPA: FkbM family methyltransferase [Bacteroidia bacterium]